jgi:hypothetical protein
MKESSVTILKLREKSTIPELPPRGRLRPPVSDDNITGRDRYIVCQALAYAIETIASLPERFQEWSSREDMKALLASMSTEQWEQVLRESVCCHLFHEGSPLQRNTAIDLIDYTAAE